MKCFNKLFAGVIAAMLIIFASANIILSENEKTDGSRPYRVEISRLAQKIEQGGINSIDLSQSEYVNNIEKYSAEIGESFFAAQSDYVLREIDGELYRFDYSAGNEKYFNIVLIVNLLLGAMAIITLALMIYLRRKIIQPFDKLKEVPYQLAKGNLTSPIKENKNRFFGKFLWGVDLLRERMEQQKKQELQQQKEKKTLLLSLSHDIKTPLSAIKLYSKALSRGLYSEKEKQIEAAENIGLKADEIENYVSQIISASKEDFLSLEVNNGEFYLSELIKNISEYYSEKLSLVKINFSIKPYSDCLLRGDLSRCVEVLQNIIENAIKYGGNEIGITFSEEEDCRLISVKNNGCTLSENELVHIFESFWRGSNASKTSGSGLGLYICRRLISKMNGDIFAEISGDNMAVTVVLSEA